MTDIQQWLRSNIETMTTFSDETYTSISDFSIMWAIFEGTQLKDIAKDKAVVDELEAIAKRVSYNIGSVDYAYNYWSQRYIDSGGQGNEKFEKLGFKYAPHSELVLRVLKGQAANGDEFVHALLLIVYRLRNNLFHGEKDMTKINGQVENLTYGALVLKDVIEASGRHVFLNVT
ncbi:MULTISPECIES: hypothetical protein [Vibrio harveyi group]|uniref:hypothetical protein n=1 Tax=Vibrio harveyi group TaxID=717610 RepID=UPI00215BBB71|nr:hypothetical protein [Vibrio alginolyticus]ELA8128123.1 hypothetical protein [Vibrio parahaemolyticus]ELA8147372.1 hypothetical protein [Vibrio parahaemolyticus]ELA8182330.1 hypothetical protein [Vibrio parahaemolyticus]ELB2733046.1 hypothetical protein [Vibrio parahaemolyticus]MCR9504346.1 hypothetical protein [Vibrio alginolyticus]